MGDCNLECLDEEEIPDEGVHEFIGPVKLILKESNKYEYYFKTVGNAIVILALIVLGATVMPVLFYTLTYKLKLYENLHVLLCTMGYQFFIPLAYLCINRFNGSISILKTQDQKLDYAVLKVFAFLCIAVGNLLMFLPKALRLSYHAFAGIAATSLLIFDILGTICVAVKADDEFTKLMLLFGLPSFVCSSVCFVLAILMTDLNKWFPKDSLLPHFLCGGCGYYTLVVLFDPLSRSQ